MKKSRISLKSPRRAGVKMITGITTFAMLALSSLDARTWTSADGSKTFEGDLKSYDAANGKVTITMANGKRVTFAQDKLSADDIEWLKKNGDRPAGVKKQTPAEAKEQSAIIEKAVRKELKKPAGELTKADFANVKRINLSQTKITDAGLSEVANKLPSLNKLYMSDAHTFTDAGLKQVAKLQKLTELAMSLTDITDAGLKELAQMKQLTRLNVVACEKVTKSAIAELQKALPKCNILRGQNAN